MLQIQKTHLIHKINKLTTNNMTLKHISEFLPKTIDLSSVSIHELLKSLESLPGVNETYKIIVAELNKRGVKAEVPE